MKYLKPWLLKFQALSGRERLMGVLATLAVLYFLVDIVLIGPQGKKIKALKQQIEQQATEQAGITKVMAELAASQPVGLVAKERAERDDLRLRVKEAQSIIGQGTSESQLGDVIRAMIGTTPGLTLVALRTLPTESLLKAGAAPSNYASPAQTGAASKPKPAVAAPPLALFKYGIEVTVKGKYPALLAYMQGLQKNPNRMYWADMALDAATYPDATLKMTVYTLSERSQSPLG